YLVSVDVPSGAIRSTIFLFKETASSEIYTLSLHDALPILDGHGKGAQRLVRADVRGSALAADVLLARCERQHVAAATAGVDGLADQAARHAAHEALAGGEEPDARAAV